MYKRQDKRSSATKKHLEKELAWLRQSPSGRRAKNKARVTAYELLAAEKHEIHADSLDIEVVPGPALGNKVIRATDLGKSYGDNLLLKDVTSVSYTHLDVYKRQVVGGRIPPGGAL